MIFLQKKMHYQKGHVIFHRAKNILKSITFLKITIYINILFKFLILCLLNSIVRFHKKYIL